MKIFVTNDDGYRAQGIKALVNVMKKFGDVTVVAPKYHQSGTAMAVTLGFKPIAVKDLGDIDGARWYYVDATPASCVKFAIDNVFTDGKPDLVVSGVNHGSNAATAACYSATLGAAQEAAIGGIPAIGVSLDNIWSEADFSAFEALFPEVLMKLVKNGPYPHGTYFNINFPNLPSGKIKGIRLGHMGMGHWEKEFEKWDPNWFSLRGIDLGAMHLKMEDAEPEEGESMYFMIGTFVDDAREDALADHRLMKEGYISITVHNFDNTDRRLAGVLKKAGVETDF